MRTSLEKVEASRASCKTLARKQRDDIMYKDARNRPLRHHEKRFN